MSDDLLRHVAAAFEARRIAADFADKKFALTPYIEEPFPIQDETLFLEQTVCRALIARAAFRETAPHWAPELPLSGVECEKMIRSKNNGIALVGYYGRSWACANWGPHLSFHDFCCGAMACEHTPEHIRNDLELQLEFIPCKLAGFDKVLCWGVQDRLAETAQQLIRTEEHYRACGMSDDARWMRSVIEQVLKVKLDERLAQFLDSQLDK